jgi:hypothetical protein
MNSKLVFFISAVVFILGALLGVAATYTYLAPAAPMGGGVACTMEAKICPDGTSVGRTGPNCEFAACPISKQITNVEKENVGSSTVETNATTTPASEGTATTEPARAP